VTKNLRLALVFGTAVLAAAASPAGASELRKAPSEAPITPTSRPIRLLRSWEETVKAGGGDQARRVQLVFDYTNGWAREDSYDTRGVLRGSRKIVRGLPAPSQEEIAEAFEITRTDPALASLFSRFAVALDGAFVLEEDEGMPCGPGSRCLQVLLMSSDRAGVIRRVVVDLVPRSLAYTAYFPDHGVHSR
jgi:hypothetical protein